MTNLKAAKAKLNSGIDGTMPASVLTIKYFI